MKISQKGLYALEAMTMLARHYGEGPVKIQDITVEEHLPKKFLEIILIELKNARFVESTRGARGGYRLRRPPIEIRVSDIVRVIDGPIAPFGDVDQLHAFIRKDAAHSALYQLFLNIRDAVANILDNTTVADIAGLTPSVDSGPTWKARLGELSAVPRNGHAENQQKKAACVDFRSR